MKNSVTSFMQKTAFSHMFRPQNPAYRSLRLGIKTSQFSSSAIAQRNSENKKSKGSFAFQVPVIKDQEVKPDFKIDDGTAVRLAKTFSKINYDPNGSDEYIAQVRQAAYKTFPPNIISTLSKLRSTDSGHPYIVIDGLPIDRDISGSPKKGQAGREFKSGNLSENILAGLGSVVGEPYSIKHEGSELVNNLVPSKAATGQYTGLGYDVDLDFHTENAMQARQKGDDTSPTELLLFGVRGEPDGLGPRTKVADSREALKLLSQDQVKTLRSNNFAIKAPYRWRSDSSAKTASLNSVRSPIITGPDHAPRVTVAFYPDMVDGLKSKATKALHAFRSAVETVSVGIRIHPGRLVAVNNRFTLHSREKFDATFDKDGNAHRWVQRVFTRPDLWNFREFNKSRNRVFIPNAQSEKISGTNQSVLDSSPSSPQTGAAEESNGLPKSSVQANELTSQKGVVASESRVSTPKLSANAAISRHLPIQVPQSAKISRNKEGRGGR
jgi:L-asparagine oxygenase